MSSDIIESITVKKSLTPDMDGDTIGASVEIETTSAFDRRKDLLTLKVEGSFNDYSGELTPKGEFRFSPLEYQTISAFPAASHTTSANLKPTTSKRMAGPVQAV